MGKLARSQQPPTIQTGVFTPRVTSLRGAHPCVHARPSCRVFFGPGCSRKPGHPARGLLPTRKGWPFPLLRPLTQHPTTVVDQDDHVLYSPPFVFSSD
jgi:hypothetical protein